MHCAALTRTEKQRIGATHAWWASTCRRAYRVAASHALRRTGRCDRRVRERPTSAPAPHTPVSNPVPNRAMGSIDW